MARNRPLAANEPQCSALERPFERSMLIHPDIHREIARQRHQDLLADARRRRVATGHRRSAAAAQIGTSRVMRSSKRIRGATEC